MRLAAPVMIRVLMKNWVTGSAVPGRHNLESSPNAPRRVDSGACHLIFQAYTRGSPWTSTSSLSTPARIGSGSRLVQFAHSQKSAVLELSTPDTTPIMRGLHVLDASPAPSIETIIMDHVMVSIVAKTRPRNSSETWRNNCNVLSTELTAIAARDKPRNKMASPKLAIWLNTIYDPPCTK